MVDMGAEVGQKMRSAIKAKLTELDCYVDDELPDYIMVMVANKRTKSQMNEDLNLFLNTKTSTFVDWLHIVLKKLKEVTVTNLEVYKKAAKRKSSGLSNVKVKREKKIKKEKIKEDDSVVKQEMENPVVKSLTDDLPLNVKSLSETRKIILMSNNSVDGNFNIPSISEVDHSNVKELQEIEQQIKSVKSRLGLKIEEDVEEAELRKLVEESRKKGIDTDAARKVLNSGLDILSNGRVSEVDTSKIQVLPETEALNTEQKNGGDCVSRKREHVRITFSKNDFQTPPRSPPRKKSVLDRLGKYGDVKDSSLFGKSDREERYHERRHSSPEDKRDRREDERSYSSRSEVRVRREGVKEFLGNRDSERLNKDRRSRDDLRKNLSRTGSSDILRKDIKKRLGISSKVTVPQIDPQLLEDTFKKREVVSVVKVKPRILPPNIQQANKNLLLKAVADAQKSVAQSKSVGTKSDSYSSKYEKTNDKNSPERFHTKHYSSKRDNTNVKRISLKEKEKLKQFLSSHKSLNEGSSDEKDDENQEYIPKPIKRTLSNVEYIPSSMNNVQDEASNDGSNKKQKFIVTLDGVQKNDIIGKLSVKERLHGRKTPSPIIFENSAVAKSAAVETDKSIPNQLPIVSAPSTKIRERCKYFPSCRNGENCEFYHPSRNCEQFPFCKFGDQCLYLHPNCKFGTSCTRRDCPYSHIGGLKQTVSRSSLPVVPAKIQAQPLQTCKFFPKCSNINCSFYHPKPCKFGKYCKNQSVCNYVHNTLPKKVVLLGDLSELCNKCKTIVENSLTDPRNRMSNYCYVLCLMKIAILSK
ncbi:hypothetical protein HHI36_009645 [Cryptolaemus montrouzieri]|uniref:Zinc finger CCCH domain-containing protein 14 n=1 Tax=Cryptolaemus montrouzieri TaxID=559131 RepID=A0ABD2MGH6_9CUCU